MTVTDGLVRTGDSSREVCKRICVRRGRLRRCEDDVVDPCTEMGVGKGGGNANSYGSAYV